MADRSILKYDPSDPLIQHMRKYEASGEDLSAAITREFFTRQREMLPFRLRQLKAEFASVLNGNCSIQNITLKKVLIFGRLCIRLMFLFIVMIAVTRHSMAPLLLPTSPFAVQLKWTNANEVPRQYMDWARWNKHAQPPKAKKEPVAAT